MHNDKPTIGELFAGIGGFSIGFEVAGWQSAWHVEINPVKRAVLSDRFPLAKQYPDVCEVGSGTLSKVDCLTAGFPCTDISTMGASRKGGRQGLRGEKSGLFWEVIRIIEEIQPRWVVLENVPALLHSNDHEDIEVVVNALAQRSYLGLARVLDAQYFGVPQKRRRIFLVAGHREMPPMELLSDASPVDAIPCSFNALEQSWAQADSWPGYTQTASDNASRINLGSELLVAEEDGWDQMVERERKTSEGGLCLGLDETNFVETQASGDSVCPQITQWIAQKLIRKMKGELS